MSLTFSYTGADLAPLLADLLVAHTATLEQCEAELTKFTPSQLESARTNPGMMPRMAVDKNGNVGVKRDEVMPEVVAAIGARNAAWNAKRDTELWLLECHRTPTAQWQLTLADLDRLYPGKSACETLAKIRAVPTAPASWLGRLIAALAAWLLPRRQVPRLPASN